jgi:hypothetical protein
MALPPRPQGALRPSPLITWADEDDNPLDLTGATITARIRPMAAGSVAVASSGSFTVTDAAAGVFRWDLDADDVATVGKYRVQFTATYGSAPSPARTFITDWQVTEAL